MIQTIQALKHTVLRLIHMCSYINRWYRTTVNIVSTNPSVHWKNSHIKFILHVFRQALALTKQQREKLGSKT